MAEVEKLLNVVDRTLARNQVTAEALANLREAVNTGDVMKAYEERNALVKQHPELAENKESTRRWPRPAASSRRP